MRHRRICCIGYSTDDTFLYTVKRFERIAAVTPTILDLAKVTSSAPFWFHYEDHRPVVFVRVGSYRFELDRSMAVYQRLIPATSKLNTGDPRYRALKSAEYAASALLDTKFFRAVVNPQLAGWSNGLRPVHYRELAAIGFRVPDYVVTSDPDDAREFLARYEQVHVKSVSHHRTIARSLNSERLVSLQKVRFSPCVFQQTIRGTDVRVHVVEGKCFAVAIESDVDDYRYPAGADLKFSVVQPPRTVRELCVLATKRAGLVLSGIDFKVCALTNDWYCLEVNPMPGYSGYDMRLGGVISEALTETLEG